MTILIGVFFPSSEILNTLDEYNYLLRTVIVCIFGILSRVKYYTGFVIANLHSSYA